MATITAQPTLGLEEIQRAAFKVLFANLNDRLTQINQYMATSDEEMATLLGQVYEPTTVEAVAPTNFYEGHRPSLVKAPIDKYPNCSIWAVRVTPAPENAVLDQISVHRTLLFMEVMVKSMNESEVNRRLLRTVEASTACLLDHPTLNGLVQEQDGDPTVNVSDVFVRKENTSYGPEWLWQGARVEYAIRKEAARSSSSASPIFGNYSQFDIDQG